MIRSVRRRARPGAGGGRWRRMSGGRGAAGKFQQPAHEGEFAGQAAGLGAGGECFRLAALESQAQSSVRTLRFRLHPCVFRVHRVVAAVGNTPG